MNWNDLKIVLALSQARSHQGAGRLLRLTHTTVARRIAALESVLGTPLFLREGKAYIPTAPCVRLIASARRIEAELAQARRDVGLPAPGLAGVVHLVSVHWIVNEILLPAIPDLRTAFPDVLLRLHGSLSEIEPEGGEALISLRFETQPARGEEAIPLARIGYAVYGPAECKTPDDLPWVSFGGSMPLAWLEAQGIATDSLSLTANDAGAVRQAVQNGIGRGLLPECLGEGHPGLQRLSGPEPEFSRILRAVGRWSDLSTGPGAAVLGWMERRFAALGQGVPETRRD